MTDKQPLERPPEVEEGDDTVARPEEHEPLEGELEDAPELDEDDLEDDDDDE